MEQEQRERMMNDSLIKMEENRRNLYWALRTRILTDEEMEKVKTYDYFLCVEPMKGFMEKEKIEEFNHALFRQFLMRNGRI